MKVTFVRLTKADAPAIARLQFESWRRSYRDVLPVSYIDGAMAQDIRKVWQTWHDEKLVIGAVASDGTLAGFATYLMRDPIYLDNFHVMARYHGTGLAADLFVAGAKDVVHRGGAALWLTVLDTNARARAFYAKIGGVERAPQEDEMLGYKVRAVPVHWVDLHAVQHGVQKITSQV